MLAANARTAHRERQGGAEAPLPHPHTFFIFILKIILKIIFYFEISDHE